MRRVITVLSCTDYERASDAMASRTLIDGHEVMRIEEVHRDGVKQWDIHVDDTTSGDWCYSE